MAPVLPQLPAPCLSTTHTQTQASKRSLPFQGREAPSVPKHKVKYFSH